MNKKQKILLGCISLLLLFSVVIGISFAYWQLSVKQTKENQASTKCLNIELEETNHGILLSEAYPISDEEGMESTPYTFTIKNICDSFVSYEVSLGILDTSTLDSRYVAAVLDYNAIQTLNQYEEPNFEGYKDGRLLQKGT